MQYTIRDIPPRLDRALRAQARAQGKSLNCVALEALKAGAGLGDQPIRRRDLRAIAGSWVEDPAVTAALEAQDQVDPETWR
jgi:hypothetical protein